MSTNLTTGKVRGSFLNVFEPKSINGSDEKYSAQLIIPKSDTDTIGKINAAVEEAIQNGAGKWGGKIPPKATLKLPLRDGDIERPDDENYANCYFLNANSKTPPGIVDRQLNKILDKSEVYSGCYLRANISFFPYNSNGSKGIACGLQHIQKVADGERLGGGISVNAAFDTLDDDEFMK